MSCFMKQLFFRGLQFVQRWEFWLRVTQPPEIRHVIIGFSADAKPTEIQATKKKTSEEQPLVFRLVDLCKTSVWLFFR